MYNLCKIMCNMNRNMWILHIILNFAVIVKEAKIFSVLRYVWIHSNYIFNYQYSMKGRSDQRNSSAHQMFFAHFHVFFVCAHFHVLSFCFLEFNFLFNVSTKCINSISILLKYSLPSCFQYIFIEREFKIKGTITSI